MLIDAELSGVSFDPDLPNTVSVAVRICTLWLLPLTFVTVIVPVTVAMPALIMAQDAVLVTEMLTWLSFPLFRCVVLVCIC